MLRIARRFSAECSYAQFESFAQHVVHAAEWIQQPRSHAELKIPYEATFANMFRTVIDDDLAANGLDARLVQRLAGAWQRLQRSGVLEARRIKDEDVKATAPVRALQVAMKKSVNAPDLRRCALPGCAAKEAHPTHFKSCAACRAVVYCCREHQVAGWPAHKKACQAARKAAEEDDGAGPSSA